MRSKTSLTFAAAALAVPLACLPLRAFNSDDRIKDSAQESYVFKTYLKADSVHVDSDAGDVTLTGTVADEARKSLAQETVAGIDGVKSVDNQLQIEGGRPDDDSDAWITTKVKTTLLLHRDVSAKDTKVSTTDGVVTLTGEAENAAQRDLTTAFAKDVDGVRDAVNDMKVAKTPTKAGETFGEKIDDASITASVKTVLLFNRSTSALNTKVGTEGGKVMLRGTARSSAEKDLATKLTSDVKGVKTVVNEMKVIP